MKKFENSHTNASGVFPDTLAIDASGPSATDGTEYVAEGINDGWGAVQALLDDTGVTPSGVTEVKGTSDILDALKILIGGEKIQPVDASVAANAMTITLNPTYLDFRSPTLGSGDVNTRLITSALTLVISSGSTLGTTSAVESKIAVIAIDNAGTVELAAINLAGGNNLDETTLITTVAEGGAGAADSDDVFYSDTLRSNVPFKVVGMIISTQATAGAWATNPSTIQGNGGNVNVGAVESLRTFTSPAQTITQAGALTIPHGLPNIPFSTPVTLKCLSADAGHSVGAEIETNPGRCIGAAGGVNGVTIEKDATNLIIRYANSAVGVFTALDQANGNDTALDDTKWEAYFSAIARA